MAVKDYKKEVVLRDSQRQKLKNGKRVTIMMRDEDGNPVWIRKNANATTLIQINRAKKEEQKPEKIKSSQLVKMAFRNITLDITNRVKPEKSLIYFKLDDSTRIRLIKPFSFIAIDFHEKHIIITTKDSMKSKKYIKNRQIIRIDIVGDMEFDKKSYDINSEIFESIKIHPFRGFFRLDIKLKKLKKKNKIKIKSLKNVGHLISF